MAILGPADACVEPVLGLQEVRSSAHAQARGLFGTHAHPDEGVEFLHLYPNPSLLPGAEPPADPRPAPGLGQHTEEVLLEAGYTTEDVARLRAAGAIG